MITIKDKLENMQNIVENVQEQKKVATPVKAEDGKPKTDYNAVDDDEVDQLLKSFLHKTEVPVAFSRLQAGLYQIGDKTLSMRA